MIIGTKVSTDRFARCVTSAGIRLVADVSDDHNEADLFGQLYDDAADRGFVLVSSRTGIEAAFYLDRSERDAEGDLIAWHFKADAASIRKVPSLARYLVTVVND